MTATVLLLCQFGCKGTGGEIIVEEGMNELNMAVCNVDSYNPLKTNSESVSEMLTLIYEPLYRFNEDLTAKGALAENITFSSDLLTLRINLADNVLWHSGAPFTAEDVVYTINQIKSGNSKYKDNVKEITSATVENYEVVLTLSEPVMNIEGLLSFPIIRNGSAAELDEKPDGTGAFYVAEKSAHNWLLLPNKDRPSSLSSVNVTVMRNDTACVNAFEMRELDVLTSAVINLGEKTPAGEIQTKMYTANQMTFLGFNCSLEKYRDPYFRLAVTNSINREELVEKAVFQKALECELPFNPKSTLHILSDGPELDVEGVMTKAGYRREDGNYINAELSILVNIESTEKISAARLISNQLAKKGIKASVKEVPFDEYTRLISSGDYDTFIGEVKMRDNLDPAFLTDSDNMFRYENNSLNEAAAGLKTGRQNGAEKIADYEREFTLNPPFAPLYYRLKGVVYNKDISGITEPNFYNSLMGIENIYFKAHR